MKGQKYALALADFKTAATIEASNPFARYNIAVCLLAQEQHQESIEYLSQAITLDPAIAVFYRTRGFAHRKCGNFAAAIRDYILAKRIDSKVPSVDHYRPRHPCHTVRCLPLFVCTPAELGTDGAAPRR